MPTVDLMSFTEPSRGLTIAEVAALSGLSAHTLRYYERIALLDPVARVHGGQRRYDADDLAWLALLQRLRATGMPIRHMQRYAELRRQGDGTIAARRALLEEHRDEVLERISELQRDLAAVTDKIIHYQRLETSDAHQHSNH
jgi:DNA-binding transcriptional MerR regulator